MAAVKMRSRLSTKWAFTAQHKEKETERIAGKAYVHLIPCMGLSCSKSSSSFPLCPKGVCLPRESSQRKPLLFRLDGSVQFSAARRLVVAVVAFLLLVSHAAVLARLGGVVLHRIQLNVLERVAEGAAATVAHGDTSCHFDHRHLSDAFLSVAAVADGFLQRRERESTSVPRPSALIRSRQDLWILHTSAGV